MGFLKPKSRMSILRVPWMNSGNELTFVIIV